MNIEKAPSFDYYIDHSKKLIIEVFEGPISLADIIQFRQNQISDRELNPTYNCITDLRKADLLLSIKEIKTYSDFINNSYKSVSQSFTALLTSTPKAAAISLQFKRLSENSNANYEVFTTLEACVKWVNRPKDDFYFVRNIIGSRPQCEIRLSA